MSDEKRNAAQLGRLYYCRHMQPGIVRYEAVGEKGEEVILVDTDGVKAMIPSGIGKPVYIHHQNVELDTMKDNAVGYVSDSFYNELDGWAWFKYIAIDDDAIRAAAEGWGVSNAYVPTQWGEGGTKNNCEYNREVLNGTFTHLAIVPRPRYEGACIMLPDEFKAYQDEKKRHLEELQNSKPTKGNTMFKMFKNKKEEVTTVDADTSIELDGKEVTIGEMLNAIKANAKEKEMENGDQMVDCDGEKMPLKELVNRYKKLNAKKNASDEDDKDDKKDEKKNDDDNDDGRKKKEKAADEKSHKDEIDDDEKKNSGDGKDHFNELRNAPFNANKQQTVMLDTPMDKLARGRASYGSASK